MIARLLRPGPLAAVLLLFAAPAFAADANQQDAAAAWRQSGDCAREAFKQYPDYTPASNAKREAARQTCLRNHKLPVTGVATAPPPPPPAQPAAPQ